MSFADFSANLPENFSGHVPVFPLPNLVMFPGVIQPLHIFERRYCAMLKDAMAGDRLIAMALLQPGWESDYDGSPDIFSTVTIGRVVTHSQTPEGKHNILLAGLHRARVTREHVPSRGYREADVYLLADEYSAAGANRRPSLRRTLVETLQETIPESSDAHQQIAPLLNGQVPLGLLADIVAFTSSLEVDDKQQLLEECDADRRASLLLELLKQRTETPKVANSYTGRFPPEFSTN